jgi:hypothetical protein
MNKFIKPCTQEEERYGSDGSPNVFLNSVVTESELENSSPRETVRPWSDLAREHIVK